LAGRTGAGSGMEERFRKNLTTDFPDRCLTFLMFSAFVRMNFKRAAGESLRFVGV
jgi:hypothetical protein